MNVICRFCSAFRFQGELLNCCHNGKVRLPSLQECPLLLRRLLECDNHEARNYRDYIRNCNAAFSFDSYGANVIMPPGRGPYCFCLQGPRDAGIRDHAKLGSGTTQRQDPEPGEAVIQDHATPGSGTIRRRDPGPYDAGIRDHTTPGSGTTYTELVVASALTFTSL
ncbi:hypothetical protein FHG87_021207 [Trinorchestia longiramus]|nr:hypothetical protein FHG87_021207 [Trinorchestia longiramus]